MGVGVGVDVDEDVDGYGSGGGDGWAERKRSNPGRGCQWHEVNAPERNETRPRRGGHVASG